MTVGVAVETSGDDVGGIVAPSVRAGLQMLGSRLKQAGDSERDAMSLSECRGIVLPHRRVAIVAASLLTVKRRSAQLLNSGHGSLTLTGSMRCAAACADREELLLAPKAALPLPLSSDLRLNRQTW
jgi:hypothetical protein